MRLPEPQHKRSFCGQSLKFIANDFVQSDGAQILGISDRYCYRKSCAGEDLSQAQTELGTKVFALPESAEAQRASS